VENNRPELVPVGVEVAVEAWLALAAVLPAHEAIGLGFSSLVGAATGVVFLAVLLGGILIDQIGFGRLRLLGGVLSRLSLELLKMRIFLLKVLAMDRVE